MLDPKAYWADKAARYRGFMDTSYHRSRLAMIDALVGPEDLTGTVVDFGCGDGVYGERVLRAGGSVIAIDIDASMVEVARQRMAPLGDAFQVIEGGAGVLDGLESASCDTFLALNVIAYMREEEAQAFYANVARILKPGGVFVCTHSNELFDMFTFNKYTVDFFRRSFGVEGVETLLAHPDKPDRKPLPTRANPLSFRHVLQRHGLEETRQEFSIPHEVPPLLLPPDHNPDDHAARSVKVAVGTPEEERWKLLFTCSIFGSRSVLAR